MTVQRQAELFVDALQAFPRLQGVFNPWTDVDADNDASARSPQIRAEHLVRYLTERIGVAEQALIAEAPGFQGCHFSGLAMTSERILLGNQEHNGIYAHHVFQGKAERTSKIGPKTPRLGAAEPTATIVWSHLAATGTPSRKIVLWNTFAFHPMKDGYLSNRKPSRDELQRARPLLEHFLSLFPKATLVPIGRVAEKTLGDLKIPCEPYVRHPANGGATAFRTGVSSHWLKC